MKGTLPFDRYKAIAPIILLKTEIGAFYYAIICNMGVLLY